MSNTDHTARPDSWARITEQAGWGDPYADLILEFSARVERLEQAQQQPAPSTPAGLVSDVAALIADFASTSQVGDDCTPCAEQVILAAADWLKQFGFVGAVAALRQEVGR